MHKQTSSGHGLPRKPLHHATKRELQRLDQEARHDLDLLRQEVAAAHRVPGHNLLVEANEHLALALLNAQAELTRSPRSEDSADRRLNRDALTGLPNRVLLLAQFEAAVADAKRSGRRLAVLFLDLDRFKEINDTLGHAVGDAVLRHVAGCLNAAVRQGDTVSRHGGDEFVVLLNDITEPADASRVATQMLACMAAFERIGEHELKFGASIGISIYPDDGTRPEQLIHLADAAMYRAKHEGSARYCFHDARQAAVPTTRLHSNAFSRRTTTLALQEVRQKQLQEANEHLLLAALGAQQLQADAERSKEEQTTFMAVLAHELRSPLAPIRNAAMLLSRVAPEELPKLQAVIERQVDHVARLISDLLDLSRVNTGKLSLQRRRVDFCSLAAEAIAISRLAMDARHQSLQTEIPSESQYVDGDPLRLVQVLCNLLDNASKYTPEQGAISFVVRAVGSHLIVTVADNGIGISADALPNVFRPSVQDTHALNFNAGGLGIGLTVVRELVQSHGGNVVAESDGPGKGSRFVVSIPLLGEPKTDQKL